MFVRSEGWFGFSEKMFMFCLAKPRKLVFLAKTTVILLYIYLRTMAGHYGFLRRPGSSRFFVKSHYLKAVLVFIDFKHKALDSAHRERIVKGLNPEVISKSAAFFPLSKVG